MESDFLMDPFDRNLLVIGCVLCPIYCWLIGVIYRSQNLKVSKAGFAIGATGILVLSGLAITSHSCEPILEENTMNTNAVHNGYTEEGYAKVPHLWDKLLSLSQRARKELGERPSKDHLAYEDDNGKVTWVTKDNFKKLVKEKK